MKIKKEECPRSINLVTEDFSDKSDATVTCTKCGAEAHDPSLLCSPDVTLASSTQLRESGQSSLSSEQSGQSGFQSGQSSQSSQSSQSGFQQGSKESQSGLNKQSQEEDIVE